jgi:hypothetical protein
MLKLVIDLSGVVVVKIKKLEYRVSKNIIRLKAHKKIFQAVVKHSTATIEKIGDICLTFSLVQQNAGVFSLIA